MVSENNMTVFLTSLSAWLSCSCALASNSDFSAALAFRHYQWNNNSKINVGNTFYAYSDASIQQRTIGNSIPKRLKITNLFTNNTTDFSKYIFWMFSSKRQSSFISKQKVCRLTTRLFRFLKNKVGFYWMALYTVSTVICYSDNT